MSDTRPTLEQLTVAGELAPELARITKLKLWKVAEPLNAATFQTVLLALRPEVVSRAVLSVLSDNPDQLGELYLPRWMLTPAGMLMTYEALVALEGEA